MGGLQPTPAVFLALDFETANRQPDSACSIGLVRVEQGIISARQHHLIRPPSSSFIFTHIHGLTPAAVADAPTFGGLWPVISSLFSGVDFIAAHNAPFDRAVLSACCDLHGIPLPPAPFRCTLQLARSRWRLKRAALPAVCDHLGIPLRHHDALADAEACARIVLAACAKP